MRGFRRALIGYIGDKRIELVPGKMYDIFIENLNFNKILTGTFSKSDDSFIFLNTESGTKFVNFDTIYKIREVDKK